MSSLPGADPRRRPARPLASLVARLDGEVDVVVAGHDHAFTNARLPNAARRDVLVTQALSAGVAFSRIVGLAHDGKPLGADDLYTVAMPHALAGGTDRFQSLATAGRERVDGPAVIDAVGAHLASLPQPVVPPPLDRISRRR